MTRYRITITLAALAVTIGAVPATSSAKPNDGRFSKSSEAFKKQLPGSFCEDQQLLQQINLQEMKDDIKAGNYVASFKDLDRAAANRTNAKKAGCAWAWV